MGTLRTHTFFFLSIKKINGGVIISNRYSQQMPAKRKDEGLVNEEIRARQVMVITDTGEKLGVIDTKEHLI